MIIAAILGACSGKGGQSAGDGAGGHPGSDAGSPQVSEVAADVGEVSGDSGDRLSEELCAAMCAVVLQIDCPNQPAMAACVDSCLGQATICVAEARAQFECLVAAGSGALQCDPDFQVVTYRDGFCTQQSQEYALCLLSQ